ncbi:putative membrane protein [Allocatelliglobosispora scoriae]|uniref:Putative membrane protein n=1 Tax=Allocatelliglobosispora scoriae TaxID=643052 RepID=A0A841BI37_9ACTN|nr:TMEM175 family protein [Allocatelliglobosispora scoriae]MBB5866988.1 putative membrane protein [Allocatelliglobosispora scoriae]
MTDTEDRPLVRLSLERTVYFSDAVIAIAMTLLAIELPVPQGDTSSQLWHSFTEHLGDEYVPFLISFAVIGLFWFQHHRFFQRVDRASGRLLVVNLACLLVVVVVPFATKVLGGPDTAFGVVFYAVVMLSWGAVYTLLVVTAQRDGLWRDDLPAGTGRRMITGAAVALAPFALSIPVAFASPSAAQYVWILAAPASVLAGRVRRPSARARA